LTWEKLKEVRRPKWKGGCEENGGKKEKKSLNPDQGEKAKNAEITQKKKTTRRKGS